MSPPHILAGYLLNHFYLSYQGAIGGDDSVGEEAASAGEVRRALERLVCTNVHTSRIHPHTSREQHVTATHYYSPGRR